MPFQIGVDIGGTFTDLVAWDGGAQVVALKTPTTPSQPAEGVLKALAAVTPRTGGYASLRHGSTIVTNAITEQRLAPTALITTRGFRDVLEIGRQNRAHLYRLDAPAKPPPLVPRHLRFEVEERVAADGSVLAPLSLDGLPAIVEACWRAGVESVAVCLLHAYANPSHERVLQAALATHFRHVSISSEINAELREYERTSTTVLNAAVMPVVDRYLQELAAGVGTGTGAPALHLLHSAGGMMSLDAARARPLAMALSGPAAGVAAASGVARSLRLSRALAFDMGGTTTDVCLIADGTPETLAERRLGGHPVRLPMVAVESIGAGGGSLARIDAAGGLKVGPESAGAQPGPAAYGLGGTEPTVTDADLVLGYLHPERVYGGAVRLDPDRARGALEGLARRFGFSAVEAAHAIFEVAGAGMLRALRLVSVQRGYDLRDVALIAYGGAGPVHAGALARAAGIRTVIVPAHSGAFSALGCLVSPLRYDAVRTHRVRLDAWDAKALEDAFRELEEQCLRPLREEAVPADRILLSRAVDLRYVGQNYELAVPYDGPDPDGLRGAFEALHRRLYGYATGERVEGVNVRVTTRVLGEERLPPAPPPAGSAEPAGQHRAFFPETGEVSLPRYDRGALPAGPAIAGPAMIEDEWSTTIVYPGQRCHADRWGNLVLEVAP